MDAPKGPTTTSLPHPSTQERSVSAPLPLEERGERHARGPNPSILNPPRRGESRLISFPPVGEARGWSALRRAQPLRDAVPTLVLLAALLMVWELTAALAGWPSYLLPRPSAVLQRLAADPGFFLGQGGITLAEALAGLGVGAGGAFIVGSAMAHWRLLERALLPLAIVVKVTPVVTIAPLLVLWFGFGPVPKVIIAAVLTFFPMLIAAVSGLRSVDPTAYDLLRTLGASSRQTFFILRLPSALPMLLAAAKVCATLSIIGTVVAEWVGADRGLGRAILLANTNLDTPTVFAGVMTLGLMGVALVGGLSMLERQLLFWHESRLSQAAEREATA